MYSKWIIPTLNSILSSTFLVDLSGNSALHHMHYMFFQCMKLENWSKKASHKQWLCTKWSTYILTEGSTCDLRTNRWKDRQQYNSRLVCWGLKCFRTHVRKLFFFLSHHKILIRATRTCERLARAQVFPLYPLWSLLLLAPVASCTNAAQSTRCKRSFRTRNSLPAGN